MTDQDRARTFVVGLTPRNATEADASTAALLTEFVAVRLDERRAVAAYLRRLDAMRRPDLAPADLLRAAADQIERGGHRS